MPAAPKRSELSLDFEETSEDVFYIFFTPQKNSKFIIIQYVSSYKSINHFRFLHI
jgi:hypothetical protein